MFLSAVSLALAVCMADVAQVQKASLAEADAYRTVRRSVVTLTSGGADRGMAVCIDSDGYFVAHRAMVGFPVLFARYGNGQTVQLHVQNVDDTTQLALLKAAHSGNWIPTIPKIADEPAKPYAGVFAVVPGAAIHCEVVATERIGVFDPSKRAVPLIELKFEAPLLRVGGAPVFTKSGELIGFLSATLQNPESARVRQDAPIGEAARGAAPPAAKSLTQYGPTGLTVGYAIGPAAIQRVFDGYRSPARTVSYAALGVMIADGKSEGVEIRQVASGSAAEAAGLQVGDVLSEIAGIPVRNQVEYTKAMLMQKAGAAIEVKYLRNGEPRYAKVVPKV